MTLFSLTFEKPKPESNINHQSMYKTGIFFPPSSFFKKILPMQARNLGVFLTSHPFLSPHSQEVIETRPSCLLPPHPLAPAQAQTSSSSLTSFSLASQPVSLLPASRALSDSDLALSLSFRSKPGHTSLHKQDKV